MKIGIKKSRHRELESIAVIDSCSIEDVDGKKHIATIPFGPYVLDSYPGYYPEKFIAKSKEDVKDS